MATLTLAGSGWRQEEDRVQGLGEDEGRTEGGGLSLHLLVGFLWNEGVEKVIPQFSADAKPCRERQTG